MIVIKIQRKIMQLLLAKFAEVPAMGKSHAGLLALVLSTALLGACSSEGTGNGTSPPSPVSDTAATADTATEEACPPETLDCECGPNGACGSTPEGLPLTCAEGLCVLDTCTPGELYCQCGEGGSCEEGAECRDDICVMPNSLLVTVQSDSARGCDLLLTIADRSVSRVTFTDGAMGSEFARGQKLGVSFIRRTDAPFSEAAAVIDLGGEGSASVSDISLITVRCVDGQGVAIEGAEVSVK